MAATFAAELETDVSTARVTDASLRTIRQHVEASLPVAMKSIHTAAVTPVATPVDIGGNASSAEFAGSMLLAGALLWQAWKRRVI